MGIMGNIRVKLYEIWTGGQGSNFFLGPTRPVGQVV